MEKKRPILSIRPHFDPGLAMVQAIMVTAVGFIVVTAAGSIFTYIILSLILPAKFVKFGFILQFFLLISIAGIPPLFYEIKKRALQRTLYNFHADYLEFQFFHFYVNRRRGRLWYHDIADVTQHASFLQEHQRLTTIFLYAPSMLGVYGRRGYPGIKIEDLQQSKGYLNKVMDVVDMSLTGRIPDWVASQPGIMPPPMPPMPPQSAPAPDLPPAPPPAATPAPEPKAATPAQPPPVTEPAETAPTETPPTGTVQGEQKG